MALVVKDRVKETTTTTGTGTITLLGAVTGFQSFSSVGNGNTTYYTISDGTNWEVGIGAYTSAGSTLSRDTVLSSSNSGSLVNFGAGTKEVFVTYPSGESVYQDGSAINAGTSILAVSNGGTGASSAASALTNLGAYPSSNPSGYTNNTGTVTSVSGSGGTTGLTLTGGPITTSGTLTLGGTLVVANGGTGATSLSSGYLLKGNGTSAVSASVVYDNGTNVGIGLTSPSSLLHVKRGSNATEIYPSGTWASRVINATDAGAENGLLVGNRWAASSSTVFEAGSIYGNGSPYWSSYYKIDGIGQHYWGTGVSGTETMRLNTTGLGIGTSSPSAKLDVNGSSATDIFHVTSGTTYFTAGVTNGTQVELNSYQTAVGAKLLYIQSAGGATSFGGNVGIGTTSPGKRLDLVGQFRASNSAASGYALLEYGTSATATNNWHVGSEGDGTFRWYNGNIGAGTERMRIDSSGNVGIGTTSPATALDVATGFIQLSSGATARAKLYADASDSHLTAEGARSLVFDTNGLERVRINSSGNVGIGTTSPNYPVDVQRNSATSEILRVRNDTVGASALITARGGGGGTVDFGSAADASTFIVRTAASERMRIDSSGNVGIGTSSPAVKLDVVGNVLAREDNSAGANPVLIRNSNTGNNTTKSSSALFQGTDTVGTVKNIGSIGFFPDDANYIGANLRFLVRSGNGAPTERMRIISAGNVIIGGGSFNAALGDMVLSKQSSGTATFALESQGSWNSTIASTSAGNMIFSNPAATERMRINSSGQIGINTSTPSTSLEVNGGLIAGSENRQTHPPAGPVGFKAQWNYTGGNGETDFYNLYSIASDSFRFYQTTGSGTAQLLYDIQPSNHLFYTGGTQRMQIDSSGNLSVGTITPLSRLDVSETTRVRWYLGTAGLCNVEYANSAANAYVTHRMQALDHQFYTNGNERMRITSGGDVGIGASSLSGKLHVETTGTGDVIYIAANTGGTAGQSVYVMPVRTAGTLRGGIQWNGTNLLYNNSSDARLKDNVADADDASSLIDAIQVRKFDWKESGNHQRYGFIAQELAEVAPEAVHQPEDEEEMMGVDYSKLVPMLIKEVQSLRARVAELEGK